MAMLGGESCCAGERGSRKYELLQQMNRVVDLEVVLARGRNVWLGYFAG